MIGNYGSVLLVMLGPFGHFESILGNFLDKTNPFQMSYLRAGFVGSFVGPKKRHFKMSYLRARFVGSPRPTSSKLDLSFFLCPAPLSIIYFAPPHFCPPKMPRRRRNISAIEQNNLSVFGLIMVKLNEQTIILLHDPKLVGGWVGPKY